MMLEEREDWQCEVTGKKKLSIKKRMLLKLVKSMIRKGELFEIEINTENKTTREESSTCYQLFDVVSVEYDEQRLTIKKSIPFRAW